MVEVNHIDKIMSKVGKYWSNDKVEKYKKILKALESMDDDKANELIKEEIKQFIARVNKMKKCLDNGGTVSKCGNPIKAVIDWLDSPEGLIAFLYIWKPRFAEKMLRIVTSSIVLGNKIALNYLK